MIRAVSILCGLCLLVADVTAQSCNITTQNELSLKKYTPPAGMLTQVADVQTADTCFQNCCNYTQDTCTTALFYKLGGGKTLCYLVKCVPQENCEITPAKGVQVTLAQMNRPQPTTAGPEMTTVTSQNENSTISTSLATTINSTMSTTPGDNSTLTWDGELAHWLGVVGAVKTVIIIFVVAVVLVVGVSLVMMLSYRACREQLFGGQPEQTKLKQDFSKAAYDGEDKTVYLEGEK